MRKTNWREIVEVIGIVSIVAALLLVAWEIRQANRAVRAEVGMQLAAAQGEIHAARFRSAEFAQLFPKIKAPEAHLITATDASRIEALAWHLASFYWSVQIAYDGGLLGADGFAHHARELAATLDRWPALKPPMAALYAVSPEFRDLEIFAPVAKLPAPAANAPAARSD